MARAPVGPWLVVDSLARRVGKKGRWVPAVETLRTTNTKWGCVVLTHPHGDHADGIADVLDEDGGGLVGYAQPIELPEDWSTEPDAEKQLRNGAVEQALAAVAARWRREPSTRWTMVAGDERAVGELRVVALHPPEAPSSRAFRDKNRLATPLLVTWKETHVVLGSDLVAVGWNEIDDSWAPIAHHGFKVAHHASKGAFVHGVLDAKDAKIWVATPWNRAKKLPRFEADEGVDRILTHVEELHLTALPFARATTTTRCTREELLAVAERHKVGELVLEVSAVAAKPGDHWVLATFDGAGGLSSLEHGDGALIVTRPPSKPSARSQKKPKKQGRR